MSIASKITRPATLHHWAAAADRNDLGDYDSGWSDAPIYCELQQQTTSELRDGRLVVVSTYQAFYRPDLTGPGGRPAADVLAPEDEVTVDGARYAMNGDPWPVRHPRTGRTSHWEAQMRKVT